ncbi:MAG: PKD domain-containing protein [Chitinophagaceae bacterium]|nr:PKD domain-containing protein [Chitinophagaceae bacterium]
MKHVLFVITAMLAFGCLNAQYTVNGNASRNDCHCYTLTPNAFNQSGSVWNNFKIDLAQSFDFNFDIYLGCDDAGADGIVFVLQPISTSVGTSGGGLGYQGVTPSVGVTVDTWQNTADNDPLYDHIAIQLNGNINHSNAAVNIAGPVTVSGGNDNIEDCQWHTLRVKWDAATKELSASIDGNLRVNVIKDFVADVFAGNPQVFWGFTGSTGGARNLQQFCTALSPKFTFTQGQKRCINEPVTFFDSTVSFTTVQKRYWDFGDATAIDSVSLNPVHTYTAAGDYTVTQTVIGADGCVEINTQPLRIGSIPVANFSITNGCTSTALLFSDSSTTVLGTIDRWNWDLGIAGTSVQQNPTANYSNAGPQTIKLSVKTAEGCESSVTSKLLNVYPSPVADFDIAGTLCKKSEVQFTSRSTVTPGSIASTIYTFGNGLQSTLPNPFTKYDTAKSYTIALTAITDKGCTQTSTKSINILQIPVAVFKFSISGCSPATISYIDSSYTTDATTINSWWWNLGNNTTSILQNPTGTYAAGGNISAALLVKNINGCYSDTTTTVITLPAKPTAKFGYTTPLCEGGSARFFDSSVITSGTIQGWNWLVDNAPASTVQNPLLSLSPGNHTVQLIVTNEIACSSNPVVQAVVVNPRPLIDAQFTDACKDAVVNLKGIDLLGTVQSWQWNVGSNVVSNVKDTQYVFSTTGSYPIVLTAVAINGCINKDSSNIIIYSTNAAAGSDTVIAAANQPIQLNATGGISYEWKPADGLTNPAVANPVATNAEDRLYSVKAYTPVGCETYDTVLIRVFDGPQIYVPTAFAPASTAGNSILKPWAVGISRFKYFTVYNRYGQALFTTSDPLRGWDGNYKGKPQDTGVYVWIAAGTSFRGNEIARRGTVVLIR